MDNIIAAEIGGTNCRFGLFSVDTKKKITIKNRINLKTFEFDSLESIFSFLDKESFFSFTKRNQKMIIAIPGPVLGQKIFKMVNVKWEIDTELLKKKYDQFDYIFMNDVLAQAYGFLTTAGKKRAKIIRKGNGSESKDIVVVSAGTGLGLSFLKAEGDKYIPIPSEAGNTGFAFVSDDEDKFRRFVQKETNVDTPTLNTIVSGLGLSLLYQFFNKEKLAPEEVVKKISSNSETAKWFSKFYARCCKNYCLTVLNNCGKLYLAGGIVTSNPFLVDNDVFRKEFITSPLKSNLLKKISIYLNCNKNIGIWGAAYFGTTEEKGMFSYK